MIIAIIILIVLIMVIMPKKKGSVESQDFYFVYSKTSLPSQAEKNCEEVFNLGGAGVVYNTLDKLYIVVGVYYSKSSAQSVVSNIKSTFSSAGIIKANMKTIDAKIQKKIKQNLVCFNFYNYYLNFLKTLYDSSIAYEKGEEQINDIYKKVLKFKTDIEQYKTSLNEKNDDVCKTMNTTILVVQEYLQSFFSSAFVSSSMKKYISRLNVLLVEEFVNMNNLL